MTGPDPVGDGGSERADRAAAVIERLPAGALDLATEGLARGLTAAGLVPGQHPWGRAGAARDLLVAPVVLDPTWPDPTPPQPVGSGAVHADLTDDDAEAFARLRSVLAPDAATDPETLAAAAQEWRLPVTPYRRPAETSGPRPDPGLTWTAAGSTPTVSDPARDIDRSRPGDTPLVVDLSALWAGPLATALLAELGASVVKIEPSARPDALVDHPAVHHALNHRKDIIDLDLRCRADRARFDELLSRADLLVDSFSRRVLPNLGYGPDVMAGRFPHLRTLSITAFPAGSPEADWVSYGPGVHAAVGLGRNGPDERARPAPIAYPDPLAGVEAFAQAASLLAGAAGPVRRVEVSLAGTVSPLLGHRVGAADGAP